MKVYLRLACMCALFVVATGAAQPAIAGEFRGIKPIPTPKALPEGAKEVARIKPVKRKVMEDAVRELMDAWNTTGLEKFLGDDFFDKSRLTDAMDVKVPRDARLRVLSIQGIQTLTQSVQPDASGEEWVVSTVSATVTTQLEFNDAEKGFQRREGVNEYIFRVKQKE